MSATSDAERALLGALLIDPECVERVRAFVAPEDFAGPKGRVIYAAVLAVADRGEAGTYIDVECELDLRGELGRVVPASEVIELAMHCPSSLYAEQYARRVAEAARTRRRAATPKDGGALAL